MSVPRKAKQRPKRRPAGSRNRLEKKTKRAKGEGRGPGRDPAEDRDANRLPRTEALLVLACAAASAMLAASQFISIFELTPPGGEAIQAIDAADQHGYATLVLAIFSLVLLVVGIASKNEPVAQVAAFAVAACGVVALLIFLVGDLPDANKIGTLDDARESFIDAKAEPVAGFWLELVGSLVLAICGAALATIEPERLKLFERGKSAAS